MKALCFNLESPNVQELIYSCKHPAVINCNDVISFICKF